MIISLDPDQPEVWYLQDAVDIMRDGGVVAYPTDTVYGIGCDLLNKKAIEKIYQIKKMPKPKPLTFICAGLEHIAEYARVTNVAFRLIKRLIPGPYTFILPATHKVPRLMLTSRRTVGIRIPDNIITSELVERLGNPLISTSLKVDEDEILSDPYKIYDKYGKQLDAVIDGGVIESAVSTIIDLTEKHPVVIREGKGDITNLLSAS